ncbi:FkbM family methyltransferase [Pseudogemmobacter humi]|uniref:Methyltransferase small domain protein n=1 Tax=Pseudogemmobacter humi TaxID=2483812 RepID=A0A3P5XBX4_9RHOB|nr:FkbM family methyltransferase [Pseudogemmobacter humi]VDC28380.1 Methyltransferase small domain protein [Pseudogemmobacter humi]
MSQHAAFNTAGEMRLFTLRDLNFELPDSALRGGIGGALASGRYEKTEADALEIHLLPGDRFLDLGAGMGFLCCLAARITGAAAVTGVEAGWDTVGFARANLSLNGFREARVIHAAAVGDDFPGEEVEFGQRPAFWASALQGAGDWPENATRRPVPARRITGLMEEIAPTVICCDIEGAELRVLAAPMPPALRLIVAEIHPAAYGPEGTRALFDRLSAQGFAYEPEGSRGATVVFRRCGTEPA